MKDDWIKSISILILLSVVVLICTCCGEKEEFKNTTEYVPVQVFDEVIYFPKVI